MATRKKPASTTPGLEQPLGKREEQLLAAARRLFARHGYQATSLRDIAEEAQMSKAALYYYFPNKEAIYGRVVIESLDALVHAVTTAVARAEGPAAQVRAFMRAAAEFLDTQRDHWLAAARAFQEEEHIEQRSVALHLRDSYEKVLRRCIAEGIEAGVFQPVDVSMATRFMLSGLNYVTRWHSPEGKLKVREVMDQFVDMGLHGLYRREA
jgi:AcrR family transcriptional regulator